MSQSGILVVLVVCFAGCVTARRLPSYIKYCHQNDPDLNQCFKNAVEALRPHLLEGIPEFGIPPLNPLVLPKASLDNGDSFKAQFSNIQIYNTDSFILDFLNVDVEKNHLEVGITFPKLRIKSIYDLDGRILVFRFKGQGPADGNYTNVVSKLTVDGSRYTKNGKEYLKFDRSDMTLNVGKPTLYFEDLFRGNRELSDQTNKLINDNIEDLIVELKPIINKTVNQFIFGIVERIFLRYSIDELFPPN